MKMSSFSTTINCFLFAGFKTSTKTIAIHSWPNITFGGVTLLEHDSEMSYGILKFCCKIDSLRVSNTSVLLDSVHILFQVYFQVTF